MSPLRVAHLVSHPIPYFAPLYRELATRPEIDLTVHFYSDETTRAFYAAGFGSVVRWTTPLLEGYRSSFSGSSRRLPVSYAFVRPVQWDLVRAVWRGGYDVVWAHGYGRLTTWLALAAGRLRGARLLVRDEQTLLHSRSWRKRLLKRIALRALLGQAAALYTGKQNRLYLRHYGARDENLFPSVYCVDNAYFQRRAEELAPSRAELRASFGIDDDAPVILLCARLVAKKQPLHLLDAFARVAESRHCWLLVAGDGPLRGDLEREVARRELTTVRLTGFLDESELPKAYTAADAFVLPSGWHETWGLVINEAMNFGLPVVVTDKVGCAADLVRPGWNGFVVPHADATALARALGAIVDDADLRAQFGARSRELVDEYTIEACADGIVAACLGVSGRRA